MRWVAQELEPRWRQNKLAGTAILICFLEGNAGDLGDARATSVRFGKVIKSEVHGMYGTMIVELGRYCPSHLYQLTHLCGRDNVLNPGPREGQFVTEAAISAQDDMLDQVTAWQQIARNLHLTKSFTHASFVYFEGVSPELDNTTTLQPINNGTLSLDPQSSYELVIHVFAPTAEARDHVYLIHVEENLMRLAEANTLKLRFKFTTLRVLTRTAQTMRREVAALKISPEGTYFGSEVSLKVDVRSTLSTRVRALLLPATSAALAASPGVLGSAAPVWLKVTMAAVGSIGLAISTRLP